MKRLCAFILMATLLLSLCAVPAFADSPKASTPKVTGVSITQGKSITIIAGQSTKLTTKLKPSGASATLKWSSSNTKIATVDKNGKVSAVKKGKATITVKAGGKKATIKVNVVNLKSIKLSRTDTVTLPLDQLLLLTATLKPEGAIGTVKWSSSDKKIATVKNGTVTPKECGTVTITAKCGKKSAKVKVEVVEVEPHVHTWVDETETVVHPEEGHYENVTVLDVPAWDETVEMPLRVVQVVHPEEGHYESLTVIDKAAWTEIVPQTKKVWITDKAAWTETTKSVLKYQCGCGMQFDTQEELNAHRDRNKLVNRYYAGFFKNQPSIKAAVEEAYGNPPQFENGPDNHDSYFCTYVEENLDPSEFVYHAEEGHWVTVSEEPLRIEHPAETHEDQVWVIDNSAWTENVVIPAGPETVHHNPVTHQETKWIVDTPEWTEEVVIGQICTGCGEKQ